MYRDAAKMGCNGAYVPMLVKRLQSPLIPRKKCGGGLRRRPLSG